MTAARSGIEGQSASVPPTPSIASSTAAPSMSHAIEATARARRRAASMRSRSARPLKTGTNADVSAPSPKSRRAKLGIAKAT